VSLHKNNTINTINIYIKYIIPHTNKTKHTQQNNTTTIIYTHNTQIKIKLTLDTKCQVDNKININNKNIKIKIRIYNINTYPYTLACNLVMRYLEIKDQN
jgi:hypothetical protein